jgi:hypothetical protein
MVVNARGPGGFGGFSLAEMRLITSVVRRSAASLSLIKALGSISLLFGNVACPACGGGTASSFLRCRNACRSALGRIFPSKACIFPTFGSAGTAVQVSAWLTIIVRMRHQDVVVLFTVQEHRRHVVQHHHISERCIREFLQLGYHPQ